ncbi:cytidyltransferase [Caulobacter virus Karma]|uniref:Putative NUDIX hydrolase domain protein n=1 Tax=Caulobacter phage CcrSwift TaxID=2927984 RepID=K4JX28_9CAUD|nr:cytidyltransferase [Caulobacter virus Magneto]YP_006989545.1 cytidyltransferase [Caulobacter virus Karma]YP_006989893.1 cytidyltransferase [Caulobacter phage CcrSwift]AFU87331.1 putative NUDIX hydrolase domain protein [Caulobacter virus Magneto]AFU87682.1 putative NUDIX hydrolase domain protein [Caulobacter virus Karma]AFU88478.1 putative NUDIX hydrolase domain protein [Caulobacter phage CcrSwift]
MDFEYDIAVLITRGQLVTRMGHFRLFQAARRKARKVLWFVGSANLARDTRNPFTFRERQEMILNGLSDLAQEEADAGREAETVESRVDDHAALVLDLLSRTEVIALNDTGPYGKNEWIAQVQQHVKNASKVLRPRVTLIGNIRDATSEYLTWFPQWPYTPVEDNGVNATALRKAYFAGAVNFRDTSWSDNGYAWTDLLYPSTIDFLERFRDRPEYAYLMSQKKAEDAYRERWGAGPFLAVDAVVECAGHILRIRRGGPEGFGMKALPGGFVNAGRSLMDNCLREVIEETALFIPPAHLPEYRAWLEACKAAEKTKSAAPPAPDCVLKAMHLLRRYQIGDPQVFDDPHRSRRAHIISTAYHFVLPPPPLGLGLPHVQGHDDAAAADWDPISEIDPGDTFEDHAFIVDRMLSLNA